MRLNQTPIEGTVWLVRRRKSSAFSKLSRRKLPTSEVEKKKKHRYILLAKHQGNLYYLPLSCGTCR